MSKSLGKVAIAADHTGVELKSILARRLEELDVQFIDFGTNNNNSVDYPDYSKLVVGALNSEEADKGILICGTGIGMSIAANRDINIRAALCSNAQMAEFARKHNDANILVLGSRVINPSEAVKILDIFIKTGFDGGRHARRIDKI